MVAVMRLTIGAKDIGQFNAASCRCRPPTGDPHGSGHLQLEPLQRTYGSIHLLWPQPEIALGGKDGGVAHQKLDRAQVHAGLQKMGGEARTKAVNTTALFKPCSFLRGAKAVPRFT